MGIKFNPFTGNFDFVADIDKKVGLDNIVAVSASQTVVKGETYLVDTDAGAYNLTFPSPTAGDWCIVKDEGFNASANNITMKQAASEKIEDVAGDYVISSNGASVTFFSDGTDWFVI